MSSFQSLRDFINQRLTAAAAEIFTEFEKTIEEELDRQRGLLDISWKPQINTNTAEVPQHHVCKEEEVLAGLHLCYEESQDQNQPEPPQFEEEEDELSCSHEEEELVLDQETETSVLLQNTSRCDQNQEVLIDRLLKMNWNPVIKLHRTDLPHQHVYKEEEVLSDQLLWNQERNSNLDQEEPELPQIKEEQEELCSSQEGEQLVLRQETDTLMMTPTDQEPDVSETESEPEQLYSHDSPLSGTTNQEQSQNLDSGSTGDVQMNPKKKHHRNRAEDKSVDHSHVSYSQLDTESGEKAFKCDVCGKIFKNKVNVLSHYIIHTGEKPFKCETCGKAFRRKSNLLVHTKTHTGEKPFKCETCGKAFNRKSNLLVHTKLHTGEKHLCKTCGKCFKLDSKLIAHIRIHTGERPFKCKTCGKAFTVNSNLLRHLKIHTGDRPFKCKTCGKGFNQKGNLLVHTRLHKGKHFFM